MISENTLWDKTLTDSSRYPVLAEPLETDVLVVGGGMSGVLAARELSSRGRRVMLIDRGQIGRGSTSANTGLLQYMSDKALHRFIEDIGEEEAVFFYRSGLHAVDRISQIAGSLPEKGRFRRRDSVYVASRMRDREFLINEYTTLKRHGFPCSFAEHSELITQYGISGPCALISHGDAEIDPYRFVVFLNEENVARRSVRVFEGTEFVRMQTLGDQVEAIVRPTGTASEFTVLCSNMVYAGGYAPHSLLRGKVPSRELVRSYAIASEALPEKRFWPEGRMIWETGRPYAYIRRTEDNRVIIGGLDETQASLPDESRIQRRSEQLKRRLWSRIPGLDVDIAYSWGALFGESDDGLPYIGQDPDNPRVLILMGYGGNGTVYSAIGAEVLADLAEGKNHPLAELCRLGVKRAGRSE